MDVMEAIYQRRSIRSYTPEPIPPKQIRMLLEAAVQAPSAMNYQPWAFVVIQDPAKLKVYSDAAKAHYLDHEEPRPLNHTALHDFHETLANTNYNLFYDASTLILICATTAGGYAPGDCCLAAQNLMLMAHASGLGSCVIGLALPWFSLSTTKHEFGIPEDYRPILPIILGHPKERPETPKRHPPEVLRWLRSEA